MVGTEPADSFFFSLIIIYIHVCVCVCVWRAKADKARKR